MAIEYETWDAEAREGRMGERLPQTPPAPRASARRTGGAHSIHRRAYLPFKLSALLDTADDFGLPSEKLLAGTDISRGSLDDAKIKTSIDQYLIACTNAVGLCGDPRLPFEVGRRLHLSAYGLYGFALLCSPTVRDGFTLAVRYHSLATPVFSIKWHETPNSFVWTFPDEAEKRLPPDLRRFLLAQQLSQHVTHVQDIVREDRRPRHALVNHEEPPHRSLYAQYLRCEVEFGVTPTQIVYDRSILDERPPLTNRVTIAMLRESCERLIGPADLPGGIAGDVARMLMERPGRFPPMIDVAEGLGMTPRTLRRRLEAEGETFSGIFDQVRCSLATTYLSQATFTVADISILLGFDDPTNFRKSFRRWTGKSPSDYR